MLDCRNSETVRRQNPSRQFRNYTVYPLCPTQSTVPSTRLHPMGYAIQCQSTHHYKLNILRTGLFYAGNFPYHLEPSFPL